MENIDFIGLLFSNLFKYFTGKLYIADEVNIFRTHNNKLDISGEIDFSLNSNAWKSLISEDEFHNLPISNYIKNKNIDNDVLDNLIQNSKIWANPINKCTVEHNKLNIFLCREIAFKNVITSILTQGKNYGSNQILNKMNIKITVEQIEDNLTILRLNLLREVLNNLLKVSGNNNEIEEELIHLTNKSEGLNIKKIVCGPVITQKFGKKNTSITSKEYYNKRAVDMRLMAQHKYGLRVNSDWSEFFEKLGKAAVTFDLLNVKYSRSLVINIENCLCKNILYNCARISTILKKFDEKVISGVYLPLPDVDQIDFTLLNQPEEWEILFVHLMQYPYIVKQSIKDIKNCKINVHNLCMFLDSLSSIFSVYYRRVRILTGPRNHLFSVLHARIYFLQAIQEVVHNALALLNISPVKQM